MSNTVDILTAADTRWSGQEMNSLFTAFYRFNRLSSSSSFQERLGLSLLEYLEALIAKDLLTFRGYSGSSVKRRGVGIESGCNGEEEQTDATSGSMMKRQKVANQRSEEYTVKHQVETRFSYQDKSGTEKDDCSAKWHIAERAKYAEGVVES